MFAVSTAPLIAAKPALRCNTARRTAPIVRAAANVSEVSRRDAMIGAAASVALFSSPGGARAGPPPLVDVGATAPGFTLPSTGGGSVTLADVVKAGDVPLSNPVGPQLEMKAHGFNPCATCIVISTLATCNVISSGFKAFALLSMQLVPLYVSANKFTVLYFYNQDFSQGCSIEAERFNQALGDFGTRKAQVVGVSMDPLEKHEAGGCTR
jgi:hypothetical protein